MRNSRDSTDNKGERNILKDLCVVLVRCMSETMMCSSRSPTLTFFIPSPHLVHKVLDKSTTVNNTSMFRKNTIKHGSRSSRKQQRPPYPCRPDSGSPSIPTKPDSRKTRDFCFLRREKKPSSTVHRLLLHVRVPTYKETRFLNISLV